ncbi:isoprenoid synthase domain-containing protein [Russula earlei]|uniref:Isoprenoid synthase domain-containing protein n=1 Tax=Russula earlei TaxID=71964 RepID=A0ACC0TSV8_9AGAM|nr:isoprenoid synthase domain-containing protein [Russula earlei]
MSGLPQISLPDPLAQWPWLRKLNDHYAEVKPESDEWLRSFQALDAKSQSSFDLCNFPLLGSLVYPLLDKDGVRVACDLMVLFFIYDEFTDKVDGDGARVYADMVMDAIRNPHKERPQGEPKLGEIARQFWLRAIKVSSLPAQERFIASFSEYVYAVIEEASDRANGRVRGIDDYLKLTRLTAGGYPAFLAAEAGLNIPIEVMAHPVMESFCALAAESLVLTNDMYSYNIEQASGHGGHNIVTVVMNEKGVDLDSALRWLGDYHGDVLSKFRAQSLTLPSWGATVDAEVSAFVERLGYWIRGIDSWSLETERYFGAKGPEVQKHRLVTLLPRKADVTPMMAQPLP